MAVQSTTSSVHPPSATWAVTGGFSSVATSMTTLGDEPLSSELPVQAAAKRRTAARTGTIHDFLFSIGISPYPSFTIFGVMKISNSRFSCVIRSFLNSQPKTGSLRNQGTPISA